MAEPPVEPEPQSEGEGEPDPQVRALLDRAFEYIKRGQRLPPPATWQELLAGMVVWFIEKWSDSQGRHPCSNCGSRDWEIGPVVSIEGSPRWPLPDGRTVGSFPHLQSSCRGCGNTVFVNALLVFEPQEPAATDKPSDA